MSKQLTAHTEPAGIPTKTLLHDRYGLKVSEVKKLNGYDNCNYLITSDRGRYIFKTYTYDDDLLDILTAETEALKHLSEQSGDRFPQPIPLLSGEHIETIDIDGRPTICRMLTFLEGAFIGDQAPSKEAHRSLGTFLAEMDLQLQDFKSTEIKARQWEWDIQYLHLNKKYIDDIAEPRDRSLVTYFFQQWEENVRPILPELRRQVIHNDANEWNILLKNGRVSGMIDFGDLAYSPLINELAIALTYACYDKEEPLDWTPTIIEAYTTLIPLEENEVKVLYYLIAARLCTSVCNSAYAAATDPDNSYATSSQDKAWAMLHRWVAINPLEAEARFKAAIGMKPTPPEPIEEIIDRRHRSLSPILSLSYTEPIYMSGAAFQYMYAADGSTYLDAYNNIPHVGHCHPAVVAAGQRQMAQLNTNTRYLYDQLADYAEQLLAKFPVGLSKVFFVNSGSAASDLALRLIKMHTGRETLMVMEHGYHGNTQASIDISDYKFDHPKGQGQKAHIVKTTIPDTYRGKYTAELPDAGPRYAQDAIAGLSASGQVVGGFISEPILGCAGQVPLADGYLQALYPAIRAQGGLCVSDEVQTGFGRVGDHFWGFEAQGVVPDIVILGKPMGNGHPMGAVVCTAAVAESFGKGVEFFSSFGGNPVSCAIGRAVLDVIASEGLQENAKSVGDHYRHLLLGLQSTHDCIGDVRGSGLFLGAEIVKPGSKTADHALAQHIKNECRRHRILLSTDGPHDSVIKTKPPLCFSKADAETVVGCIDEILTGYETGQF